MAVSQSTDGGSGGEGREVISAIKVVRIPLLSNSSFIDFEEMRSCFDCKKTGGGLNVELKGKSTIEVSSLVVAATTSNPKAESRNQGMTAGGKANESGRTLLVSETGRVYL